MRPVPPFHDFVWYACQHCRTHTAAYRLANSDRAEHVLHNLVELT